MSEPASADVAIEASLVEVRPERPPRRSAVIDVSVRNAGDGRRWVLVPAVWPVPDDGGVFAVHLSRWGAAPGAPVIRLLGRRSFHVLALGAGADVRLRALEISCWDEVPRVLPVTVAASLGLGDTDIEDWLPWPFVCEGKVDAGGPTDLLSTRATDDRGEVCLVSEVVGTASVTLGSPSSSSA